MRYFWLRSIDNRRRKKLQNIQGKLTIWRACSSVMFKRSTHAHIWPKSSRLRFGETQSVQKPSLDNLRRSPHKFTARELGVESEKENYEKEFFFYVVVFFQGADFCFNLLQWIDLQGRAAAGECCCAANGDGSIVATAPD